MKILHIDTELGWRGGENQMRLLIEGLKAKGILCHLTGQPHSELIKRLGRDFPVLPLKMRGEADLLAAYRLAHYCRKESIDIIDCQTAHAHSLGLWCKRLFYPRARLVVHRRVDNTPKAHWFNRLKYTHPAVDHYVAISAKIADVLMGLGIPQTRITTVYSAVDPKPYAQLDAYKERQKWRQRLAVREGVPLIGQAAAMTAQKGYETLLRALAELKARGRSFHCALAGDGPLRPSLERLCQSLNLQNEVTFLGWLEAIPSFLTSLDVFVLASHNEGLGTILLEAIYAGCYIVASKVGGIPEIITHEKSGLLAPPKDIKALANCIEAALKYQELSQNYHSGAQVQVSKKFSLEGMVNGNLEIYQKLLSRS